VDGHDGDRGNGCKDRGEQGDDEEGRSSLGFGRGLSDAHGVDEGIRDEKEELHIFSMTDWGDSSRNRIGGGVGASIESGLAGVEASAYT
jgi:hypothetical protein